MLLVKQELLGSLAAGLEKLFPGAGAKAAFESPKVAAHGDFACTAAMQLAKPLERKPRELAEDLSAALLGHPAFHAVGRCDRDRRPGLPEHPPQDRRQAAGRARGAGRRRGFRRASPTRGRARAGRVRLGQPDRPAARGPRPPGRAGRRHLQPASRRRAGRSIASSITTTPACRSRRWPTAPSCAPRASSPATPQWPEQAYNGEYIADIAAGLHGEEDRAARTTASTPPAATSTTSTRSASSPWPTCATSRTWT